MCVDWSKIQALQFLGIYYNFSESTYCPLLQKLLHSEAPSGFSISLQAVLYKPQVV